MTDLQNAIYTRAFEQILCHVPSRCVSSESRPVRVYSPARLSRRSKALIAATALTVYHARILVYYLVYTYNICAYPCSSMYLKICL